jgi:hypothetical protein
MKVTPWPKSDVPRKHYDNIGVTLSLGDHAARVRDVDRATQIDAWNKMGVFKVIKVDNVVVQSTGTSMMLMLNQSDVNIEVITDHQWTDKPSNVRHSQIDYFMTYSYTGQLYDFTGDGTVPEGAEKVLPSIVPEHTDWS